MGDIFNSLCGLFPGGCDNAGVWLAALLTLLVFSYLIGDSFLFRLAQSLLVGTAIGYGSAVVLRTVVWDRLLVPLLEDSAFLWKNNWPLFVPLILGLLLLSKLVANSNAIGNISLGYLFGVGAALAIGGAMGGALLPQLRSMILSFPPAPGIDNWINNSLIVVGTLGALLAFRFVTRPGLGPLRAYSSFATAWGRIGSAFIMVAFGAMFANTVTARVSTLAGQMYFLLHDWLRIVK
jgi:hypothetical protein